MPNVTPIVEALQKALGRAAETTPEAAAGLQKGLKEAKVVRPIEREAAAAQAAKEAEAAAAERARQQAAQQMQEQPAAAPAPVVTSTPQEAAAAAQEAGGAIRAVEETPQAPPAPREADAPVLPETAAADSALGTDRRALPADETPAQTADQIRQAIPEEPVRVHTEAEGIAKAELGQFATDASHMPNFDRIATTDDIKATIAHVAEQNKGRIDEARRGVITHDQLQKLADDLSLGQDVVGAVLSRESGGALNAETVLAARQVLVSSAERLKGLADKVVSGNATDLEKVQFARQAQFHREYQVQFMGARAEAGRALNAFGIPAGSDPQQIAHMADLLGRVGNQNIDQLAAAIKQASSVKAITKLAVDSLGKRMFKAAGNLVTRVFVNGILSNPKTHFVNTIGNLAIATVDTLETGMAAQLGRVLSPGEGVAVGEAMAKLRAAWHAVGDAMTAAQKVIKTGETPDHVVKIETGGRRTTDILPELGADHPWLAKLSDVVDNVIDAPTSRGLASMDEVGRVIAYRSALEADVYRQVTRELQAGELSAAETEARARSLMENPTPEMEAAAEQHAREMTFQQAAGAGTAAMIKLTNTIPVLRIIVPFIRTPVNIFKASMRRGPLALFMSSVREDIAAGGARAQMAYTRMTWGTALAGWGLYETLNGSMTGGGPQQPAARAAWLAAGNQPYSIRMWDEGKGTYVFHSYARIEPIATMLGIVSDAAEILTYMHADPNPLEDDEQRTNDLATMVVGAIMRNTLNKTFMQGLSQFVEAANNPGQYAASWMRNMATGFVPYSGTLKAARNIADPYMREVRSTLDAVKNTIPGYSTDLPPKRSLFGEIRETTHGSLLGTFSPIPDTQLKHDRVYDELVRLQNVTQQVPVAMPNRQVEGMQLTPGEYDKLTVIARSEPLFDGQTLKGAISDVMDDPSYQAATPDMRGELIRRLRYTADRVAASLLEERDPSYAARISNYRSKKNMVRYGQEE